MNHYYPFLLKHTKQELNGSTFVILTLSQTKETPFSDVFSTSAGENNSPACWGIAVNASPSNELAANLTVGGTFAVGLTAPDDFGGAPINNNPTKPVISEQYQVFFRAKTLIAAEHPTTATWETWKEKPTPLLRIGNEKTTENALAVTGITTFDGNFGVKGMTTFAGDFTATGLTQLINAKPAPKLSLKEYTLDIDGKIAFTGTTTTLQATLDNLWEVVADTVGPVITVYSGGNVKIHHGLTVGKDLTATNITADGDIKGTNVTATKNITAEEGNIKATIGNIDATNGTITGKNLKATNAIGAGGVDPKDLATGTIKGTTVDAVHVKTDTLKAGHIDTDTLKAGHIDTDTLKAGHIDTDTLKADRIRARKIRADRIKALNINALNINTLNLNALNINAFNINVWHLNAHTVNADTVNADTVNADTVNADTVNADTVNADTVNAGILRAGRICGGGGIIRPPPPPALEPGSAPMLQICGGFIGQKDAGNFCGPGKYIVVGQAPPVGPNGGRYGVTIRNGIHFCSLRVIPAGDTILSWGHANRLRIRYEGPRWRCGKRYIFTSRDIINVDRRGRVLIFGGITTSSYSTICDERYKEAIEPLAGSLDKVLAMRGVSYLLREDLLEKLSQPAQHQDLGEDYTPEQPEEIEFADTMQTERRRRLGLVAQEVEKVCPELISTDDDGYKVLDLTQLNPLLLEAIKEQQRIIEMQDARLASLEKALVASLA